MFFSTILTVGLIGAPSDSLSVDTLETVVVTADKGGVVSRTDTMAIEPNQDIRDVIQSFSSLYFSDYGGVTGLKTVSFRGLGSSHTNIYIDGVKAGNLQSGQNDLGMLGMDSYSMVAADYAQNAVYFNTSVPKMDKKVSGTAAFSAGSWATYHPYARLNVKLGEKVVSSFTASGIFSQGDYKYADDAPRRKNNDIKKGQFGADFWGVMKDGKWHAKAYANTSERGSAGSLSWPSRDRQKDNNAFIQASLQNRFTKVYELNASTKFSFDHLGYKTAWGDNYYDQYEGQLNTSHIFRICKWFTLSAAADAQIDKLDSDNYDARRTTFNGVLTTAFHPKRVKINLSADFIASIDKDGENRKTLSPAMDLRVMIVDGFDFVAFGKRSYRIPTFNELYYVGFGNPDLKPEDAWLTDFGFELRKNIGNWYVKANANGFYNYLQNKIISAPTPEDPNVWAPYNIGKVKAAGFDLSAGFEYQKDKFKAGLTAKYTLISAKDKTPDSYTFDQQIPYVPKHAVVLIGNIGYDGWALQMTYNSRGGRTDSMGDMPRWSTLDMRLSKTFNEKYNFFFAGKNIANKRYDISTGYPMPGISVEGGFNLCF